MTSRRSIVKGSRGGTLHVSSQKCFCSSRAQHREPPPAVAVAIRARAWLRASLIALRELRNTLSGCTNTQSSASEPPLQAAQKLASPSSDSLSRYR